MAFWKVPSRLQGRFRDRRFLRIGLPCITLSRVRRVEDVVIQTRSEGYM
jgi:hypothetical protein